MTSCVLQFEVVHRDYVSGNGAGFDFRAVFQIDSFDCANRELQKDQIGILSYQANWDPQAKQKDLDGDKQFKFLYQAILYDSKK